MIEPHKKSARKLFRRVDTVSSVAGLQQKIDAALRRQPGVNHIRWATHDEFNGG